MTAVREPSTQVDAAVLRKGADLAIDFIEGLPDRPVGPTAGREELLAALGGHLPSTGEDPAIVVEELARNADPGLTAMPGPRYFGFVIGGSLPAAVAADWLTSAWDQNTGIYAATPATAVIEEVAAGWLLDVLGLPPDASVGFVTGCQMAHFTALAAARNAVLAREGWNVEEKGLIGAPPVTVITGGEAHVTVVNALRMLGLGAQSVLSVEVDEQGRMRVERLEEALARSSGPTIVCAQAGNVNTGSFDPIAEVADVVRRRDGVWLHVDGAFGLWAAATPQLRHLVRGVERADSWATDGHKWLNVPYDSGIAIVAHPEPHRAAMGPVRAAYLLHAEGAERDPFDWVPEYSRRARGVPIYAALRSLGRDGVAELVERCCRIARRMADRLAAEDGVEILNDVVLNQVLVRFNGARAAGGDSAGPDSLTRSVIDRVQRDGTCWLSGTTWHGMGAMRISVSNWSTTETDGDRSADAIIRCYREAAGAS